MNSTALQSMTGFGKANGHFRDKKIAIEVRSLNSKGLDLNLKIPSLYRDLEAPIRKLITDHLLRGKMDLGIYIESQNQQLSGQINEQVATAYFEKFKSLNDKWQTNTQDYLALVLRMPDVLSSQQEELDEAESQFILSLVAQACEQLQKFRQQEGASLATDLLSNLAQIQQELGAIVPFEQERVQQVKDRIQKGLASIDENVEKLDISEEKQRLQQHLNYFTETLQQEASGKKLGFIAQEMGREINTLGSKCNHSEIQRRVVIMKDHLEKIKEQVLNAL